MDPARLLIYDRTCTWTGPLPLGLTHSWVAGSLLYASMGRLHASFGATSWEEALSWLVTALPGRPIAEVQFWGHGNWGTARIGAEVFDRSCLVAGHPLRVHLDGIRDRLTGPEALWWWRTCETFGGTPGQDFARAQTELLGCRTAGHTFIIGPWQSGLHSLAPGAEPAWDPAEGLYGGTPEKPTRARISHPLQPQTITALHGAVPEGW